jgi:hypothetical protein
VRLDIVQFYILFFGPETKYIFFLFCDIDFHFSLVCTFFILFANFVAAFLCSEKYFEKIYWILISFLAAFEKKKIKQKICDAMEKKILNTF